MAFDPLAGLTPLQRADISAILSRHVRPTMRIAVFGSRARETPRPGADLDLAISGADDAALIDRLRSAFAESDLSIHVDVVDYDRMASRALKVEIDRDAVPLLIDLH